MVARQVCKICAIGICMIPMYKQQGVSQIYQIGTVKVAVESSSISIGGVR